MKRFLVLVVRCTSPEEKEEVVMEILKRTSRGEVAHTYSQVDEGQVERARCDRTSNSRLYNVSFVFLAAVRLSLRYSGVSSMTVSRKESDVIRGQKFVFAVADGCEGAL